MYEKDDLVDRLLVGQQFAAQTTEELIFALSSAIHRTPSVKGTLTKTIRT